MKIEKKLIFYQYLEIGGRLQHNFANFNVKVETAALTRV